MGALKRRPEEERLPDGFTPDGIFNGIPYRFVGNSSIDAVIRGAVVRFEGFTAFVAPPPTRGPFRLCLLLTVHVVIFCASLYFVQEYYSHLWFIAFDSALLPKATLSVALFSIVLLPLFSVSQFSFGYYVGFYLFNVILGYAWLVNFSIFDYAIEPALISIFLSAVAFLVPSLFLTPKLPQRLVISEATFDQLLSFSLMCSAIILAISCVHSFRIVGINEIYNFRDKIQLPLVLEYAIGMTVSAILPFVFAASIFRRRWLTAVAALVVLFLFFPVMLTKITLFAPFWLLFLLTLSRLFEARVGVVLSLLLPISAGVVSALLTKAGLLSFPPINLLFGTVNFRMIAIPSLALDFYNDFFSHHPLTNFCQVSFLKHLMGCRYSEPLGAVMEQAYGLGSFNASLFATEGIASAGPMAAPLSALVCGLVISLANGAASGLPPKFVLLSSGIVVQSFVNVPFTTTLLTGGAGLLFLLWYVTPRSMFIGQ
jgi:hypothetical protein